MLTYDLDQRGDLGLYEFLYRSIARDIASGVIAPDQKMPSKRALARHLGVSVITVEGAYTQLVAEGYLRSVPRSGFYANEVMAAGQGNAGGLPGGTLAAGMGTGMALGSGGSFDGAVRGMGETRAPGRQPAVAYTASADPASPAGPDGIPGCSGDAREPRPALADLTGRTAVRGLFPYDSWSKAVRAVLAQETGESLRAESDPKGSPRLRAVLADYLHRQRGMLTDPACIVIGAGSQYLDILLMQMLGTGRRVAVEDPGYSRLGRLYANCGMEVRPVPLGEDGIRIDDLIGCGASIAHLMPSHQYPTGAVMPIAHRYQMLAWANEQPDRYIIEDDYDSEFRLAGKPIPTLQSIDRTGRVIYTNTFSKTLGAAFRMAYMVLPPQLMGAFDRAVGFYSCSSSVVDQLALAAFIARGDYERHLNRTCVYYRGVAQVVNEARAACDLAGRMTIMNGDGGLHFILHVDTPAPEKAIASAAAARGVRITPLVDFFADATRVQAAYDGARFFVSYEGIDQGSVDEVFQVLSAAVLEAE